MKPIQKSQERSVSEEYHSITPHTDDSIIARYYQVRTSDGISEYDLSCNMKMYLLEQKKTKCSLGPKNGLESLVHAHPDTGSFDVVEQEYHDLQDKNFFEKQKTDHFLILKGTPEELSTIEQYFISNNYALVDAKVCPPNRTLSEMTRGLEIVHNKNKPSLYQRVSSFLQVKKVNLKRHFHEFDDFYGFSSIALAMILGMYSFITYARSTADNEHRGVFTIMKEDFFGRQK